MDKPADLGYAGGSLWDEVVNDEKLQLRSDEFRVLELACRQLDTIAELRSVFNADPEYTVKGSMKQPVINPLIAEMRVAGDAYARYMRQLSLPDDEERALERAAQTSEYFRRLGNLSWEARRGGTDS
ncbi:hypothetical protein [Pseudonocardia sp. T1-2H]|uniref:hypothetical protein n=1 Tax=Pseudonocardia sp. T1-2H TaxID=3128899 RepID=UPI0031010BB8